jgi:hypothetical protein
MVISQSYEGADSGTCYLKTQLPASDMEKATNFTTAAKANSSAVIPSSSAGSGGPTAANVGAIVGGVVGGMAGLAFILFLVIYITKRHRQQAEQDRTTLTSVNPIAAPMSSPGYAPSGRGHGRSGSTTHDAFAPTGGSYYPPTHTRQRSIYQAHDQGAPTAQQWV